VDFVPVFLPVTKQPEDGWWFIFCGDKLLVKEEKTDVLIPSSTDVSGLMMNLISTHGIGRLEGKPCYASEVHEEVSAPTGMIFQGLRSLLGHLDEEVFLVAGRAFQCLGWDKDHQYCGKCGGRTELRLDELARSCPACGLISHPEVTPAVIVAVIRGEEILLARSHRFQGSFFSVLAGFVEAGETFERCVKREVREEVAIEVDNIRYFGSQPWPFPHSLMVGFTAEYAGGEISIDDKEISEAGWFTAETLPEVPRTGTIARRLIEWFCDNHKPEKSV